jgi:hypothetical protein
MLLSTSFGERGRKPKGKIMKYLVMKSTVAGGRQVKAGDVIELDSMQAKELVSIGRLIEVVETETKVEDRSVGLTEETKPKRRARRKAQ